MTALTSKPVALITGRAGFTGQYVSRTLECAGYQVIGLEKKAENAKDWEADLTDAPRLREVLSQTQPEIVVHLAAVAFVAHQDANAFYHTNIIGTRNLLEAVAVQGKLPKKILLASSANIYGNATSGILDESAPPSPINDYAVSKLAMEYMAQLWRNRLPLIIARPFNYTGIGQSEQFLLPKIVSHFKRKMPVIELGNLDVWRDFSDVRSVSDAYLLLLRHAKPGTIVNVCSGAAYSIREIIALCENITNHKIQVQVNPEFVRHQEVRELIGDNTELRKITANWKPIPLKETIQWMLNA